MTTIEISQKLRKQMEEALKPNRFDHTLGVAYTAANMAEVLGADKDKALIAGMLHDCAKCLEHDVQFHICEEYGVDVSDTERSNPALIHAKAGMCLAQYKYEISDPEILNAIRFHTTGRPDMSLLEKIVFTADFIEPNRKDLPELDMIRKEAFSDIDLCVRHILFNTVKYLESTDKESDEMTMNAFRYYDELINNR